MQIKDANFYSNTNVRVIITYEVFAKLELKNVGIVNTFTFLSVRINKNDS